MRTATFSALKSVVSDMDVQYVVKVLLLFIRKDAFFFFLHFLILEQ